MQISSKKAYELASYLAALNPSTLCTIIRSVLLHRAVPGRHDDRGSPAARDRSSEEAEGGKYGGRSGR